MKFQKPTLNVDPKETAKRMGREAIPGPIYAFLALIASGSILGIVHHFFGNQAVVWTLTAFAILGGVMWALGWLFKGRKAAKKAASFKENLTANAAGMVQGVTDPGEMARMDDLRKNFEKGIKTFEEYGKDPYSLPWYVMCGEPGSGKTEAIRHSSIRFPETLQDRLQGTGGTYSMHWWFTSQAVILDTAGAMLTEPSAAKRFQEFLRLLTTSRPDCPINGLILAIPIDSLILDDPAIMEEKAKLISAQFGLIQQILNLRFPMYVMVTKSDRMPGFREFFDAPGQAQFEREMVGWSNPLELDEGFDPAIIPTALNSVADRLRARRLQLLLDPIPQDASKRRTDEVDALYAFPETVQKLIPGLQRYLEIVYRTGEWATMPPFFRGIYFTSSMREGATLDRDLANALGIPPERLPQGGIWEREKSFFLRDVFVEKIFKERGLITRLLDIRQVFKRRLLWFYGLSALLLALLFGTWWAVGRSIGNDLLEEKRFWKAANDSFDNGAFLPIVQEIRDIKGEIKWDYRGNESIAFKSDVENLVDFHSKLEKKTRGGLSMGWVFRPGAEFRKLELDRQACQRIIFEASVVKPLVDAAREKIRLSTAAASSPQEVAALAALIELEAFVEHSDVRQGMVVPAAAAPAKTEEKPGDKDKKEAPAPAPAKAEDKPKEKDAKTAAAPPALPDPKNPWPFDRTVAQRLLEPLFEYVVPGDADPKIYDIAAKTYGPDEMWFQARDWMSGGKDLAENKILEVGLKRFLGLREQITTLGLSEAERQKKLVDAAKAFGEAENALQKLAESNAGVAEANNAFTFLEARAAELDTMLGITDATAVVAKSAGEYQQQFALLRNATLGLENNPGADDLFKDIQRRLEGKTMDQTDPTLKPAGADQLIFDTYLNVDKEGGGKRFYSERLEAYRKHRSAQGGITQGDLLGRLPTVIQEVHKQVETQRPALAYKGPRAAETKVISDYLFRYANQTPVFTLLERYYDGLMMNHLPGMLFFPLVQSKAPFKSSADLVGACTKLEQMEKDFASEDYVKLAGDRELAKMPVFAKLEGLRAKMGKLTQIRKALVPLGKEGEVTISVGAIGKAAAAEPVKAAPPPPPAPLPGQDPADPALALPPLPPAPVPAGVTNIALIDSQGTPLIKEPPGTRIKELSKISISSGLTIEIWGRAAAGELDEGILGTTAANYTKPWGVMQMVFDFGVDRAGSNRSVTFKCRGVGNVPLIFAFQDLLPSKKEWPTRISFGIKD